MTDETPAEKKPWTREDAVEAGKRGVAIREARKASLATMATPLEGMGPERILADMEHVYNRPEAEDDTPGKVLFRDCRKNDPEKFARELTALSVKIKIQPDLKDGPQETKRDVSSENVEKMIEELQERMRQP